jgi:glycerol-3-phosphate acyltransferase PlsY
MSIMAFWMVLGFLAGSLPFSVWLGRLFAHADIRQYGDRNPGAVNVGRAAGWRVGLAALLLDALKGCVPVGLAHFRFGVSGWGLALVALAPVVGHAFSPFLRFRGGKAVAVTFGIWTGLRLGEGPIMLGLLVAIFALVQSADAWSVVWAMFAFLVHLLLRGADAFTIAVWAGNVLILLWKHRQSLQDPVRLRPWLLITRRRTRLHRP